MDPDEMLERLRNAIASRNECADLLDELYDSDAEDCNRLDAARDDVYDAAGAAADCAESLIEWLDKGGFLPACWNNKNTKETT